MMRKTSLMFFGALGGAALTVIAIEPPSMSTGAIAKAESSDTYRQLNLFGDIFERVRAHYVEKPEDSKLVEASLIPSFFETEESEAGGIRMKRIGAAYRAFFRWI